MKKEKYLVFSNSSLDPKSPNWDHDYDIKVKRPSSYEKGIYLSRSKSEHWTNPGEQLMRLIDTGDGVIIGEQEFDYERIYQLKVLLDTYELTSATFGEFEIVQKKEKEQWKPNT